MVVGHAAEDQKQIRTSCLSGKITVYHLLVKNNKGRGGGVGAH